MKKHIDDNILIKSGKICKYVVLLTAIYLFLDIILNYNKVLLAFNREKIYEYSIELLLIFILSIYTFFSFSRKGMIFGFSKNQISKTTIKKPLIISIILMILLIIVFLYIISYSRNSIIYNLEIKNIYKNIREVKLGMINYISIICYIFSSLGIFYFLSCIVSYFRSKKNKEDFNLTLESSKLYRKIFLFLIILLFIRLLIGIYFIDLNELSEYIEFIGKEVLSIILLLLVLLYIHAANGLVLGALDSKDLKFPFKRILKRNILISLFIGFIPLFYTFLVDVYYEIMHLLGYHFANLRGLKAFISVLPLVIVIVFICTLAVFIFLSISYFLVFLIIFIKRKIKKDKALEINL